MAYKDKAKQLERNRRYYRQIGRSRYLAGYTPDRGREANLRNFHGLGIIDLAMMLEAQGGCCYLCADPLTINDAVIDHDHRCCKPPPKGPSHTCAYCRRGLACNSCNTLIGMARDDPERLVRIASALAVALSDVAVRQADKPQQLGLFEAANPGSAAV